MTQPSSNSTVHSAEARATVQVRWPDGRAFEAPLNTALEAFVRAPQPPGSAGAPVVAALVDGKLRELTYKLTRDASLAPVTMATEDGMRIYRRGLTFLMIAAAKELFPEAEVVVDHSIASGGYFCQVRGRDNLNAVELKRLTARMKEMATADLPIVKDVVPLAKAIELFRARGEKDKVSLLAERHKDYLVLYRLGGLADYFHGYMVPSAGYLRWFDLQSSPPGFILQFPQRRAPTVIEPLRMPDRLMVAFREYGEWLDRLGISNVGALNEAIGSSRIRELILVSEALHEQRIAQIAGWVAKGRSDIKLVLIAGPSSSGKTTFSKRLAVQLLANGLHPFALAMDEYFLDRDKTPKDENGEYDFESLRALDVERFNVDLLKLMGGQEVILPHYDFKTGRSGVGETVTLPRGTVILVEGIHGLNPDLVPHIPPEHTLRIYISALTQLNLDLHNRVSTTDTRLIRRIVRDAATRGYAAGDTLKRWESVRRGESQHIFPYQEYSDVMFNSALVYELSVLRPLAEPLLRQVQPETPEYVEAKRLLALLAWFRPCDLEAVPNNSLLTEFIRFPNLFDGISWTKLFLTG
ncbi:MAG: nucleoside kinase [Chloroflexi bacterium]|nr:nucleoside kinase [Chloroflexota bacterium]